DGRLLHDVHPLAAAVIPAARITLGVLVRQDGPGGFEDRAADEVLRGDEFETVVLPEQFVAQRRRNLRVRFSKVAPDGNGSSGHDVISSIARSQGTWRPPHRRLVFERSVITAAAPPR